MVPTPNQPLGHAAFGPANASSDSTVMLVHGFAQNRHCWGGLLSRLVTVERADDLAHHRVIAIDAPGHGDSTAIDATFDEGVDALAKAGAPGTWIGYSMGARYCLWLALRHPNLVTQLVLISGTAGIADGADRLARIAADNALADRIEREGIDAFLDEWLALPMFATLNAETAQRDARRRNTAAGLASSLRRAGTGAMPSAWDQLPTLHTPTLIVTGARDEKFTAIGAAMEAAAPPGMATRVVVPGVGHSVHLEAPDVVARLVTSPLGD